jgi:hypothetical protein
MEPQEQAKLLEIPANLVENYFQARAAAYKIYVLIKRP